MGAEMKDDLINKIIQQVYDNLTGRFANAGNNAKILLSVVEEAGDGHYLEIGVMHGGSLCAVALLKKHLGHTGVCVGVDPFDGFYFDRTGKINDPKSNIPVIEDTVLENIKIFQLNNIELIKAYSPEFKTDKLFRVAFIDGKHTERSVWDDWQKIKDITTDYVVFHDYGAIQGVTNAVNKAADDIEWDIYTVDKMTAVMRRKE